MSFDLMGQFLEKAATINPMAVYGIWRERPVGIYEFFTSKDYLGENPYPGIQTELLLAAEQIICKHDGGTVVEEFAMKNEMAALLGKGAGKDFLASGIIAYLCYRLCCMADPQKFYNFGQDENIDIVNVALNAYQAKYVFFKKLKARLRNCKWFVEVQENPSEMSGAMPNYFQVTQNQIRFCNSVTAHSTHSEAESFEGFNPLAVIFDELGGFETINAENCIDIFTSSAATRFNDGYFFMYISYPRHANDYMMKKYKESLDPTSNVWGIKGKSWEVNPSIKREHLQKMYDTNPEKARTMYECDPPENISGLYQFPEKIDEVVRPSSLQIVSEPKYISRVVNTGKQMDFVGLTVFGLDQLDPAYKYYLGGDAGVEDDSYTICLMRGVPTLVQENVDGELVEKFVNKPVEELLLQWKPDKRERYSVDLLNVADILEQICRMVHVKKALFDKFNSAECVQRLQTYGVEAEDKNFSNPFQYNIHSSLKGLVYTGFVELLDNFVANDELKHLKTINGNKITHEKPYGKDLSDARASAAWLCVNDEVEDLSNYSMPLITGAIRG